MVMQLDVQAKKFAWDALIKHQEGFGFNDAIDEAEIPGPDVWPVALPAAKRVSESGKLSQIYSRAVAMFARKELTEAEKEAKEQYTLSKHRLLRFIFSHTYYEVSAAVVVAAAVIFIILTVLDPETSEALVPQAETEKSIVELVDAPFNVAKELKFTALILNQVIPNEFGANTCSVKRWTSTFVCSKHTLRAHTHTHAEKRSLRRDPLQVIEKVLVPIFLGCSDSDLRQQCH
jgi:hypothetical protein